MSTTFNRIFYRLEIAPSESDGEGEDHDEWFTSLEAARRRRAELIRADPHLEGHRYGSDFCVSRVILRDLSPKALVLAVLNRAGHVESSEEVVPEYKPKHGWWR